MAEDGRDNDGTPYFDKLPPEMVTSVLEFVEPSSKDILNCRQLSHRFQVITDVCLERRQLSAWSWSRSIGESKPTSGPGPLKRPPPCLPPIHENQQVDRFLKEFPTESTSVPGGCVYIRRVRSNLPPTRASGDEDITLSQLMFRSKSFFEQNPDQGVISIGKILELLDHHGPSLTSFIFECGVTTDLTGDDLSSILQRIPNVEGLMLKGVRAKSSVHNLPALPNLKHLKIIYSQNITSELIAAYHSQLESLQIINGRDSKCLSNLDFPLLKALKIGDFDKLSEDFDSLSAWLKGHAPPKLTKLAVYYPMFENFSRHAYKLFECLAYLPRLEEFHLGNGARQSFALAVHNPLGGGISLDDSTPKQFPTSRITKLTLPIEMFFHLELLHQILCHFRTVRELVVLDCDRRLWDTLPQHVDQMLGLTGPNLSTVLNQWLTNYGNLSRIKVVTAYGGEERLISQALK